MVLEYPTALLLLFFLPVLILLEVLRNRRREQKAASVSIWRQALADSGEKARRKVTISLGLVLLILAFLLSVIGASLPSLVSGSNSAKRFSLVMDVSASMKAGGSFSRAVADARQYVSSVADNSLFTIVEGGANPLIACSDASAEEAVRSLDRFACADTEADLAAAVRFALTYEPDVRPLLFTDHLPGDVAADFRSFGSPLGNIGFVTGKAMPGGLFFAVANYSSVAFDGAVLLQLEGTPSREVLQLSLKPGERRDFSLELAPSARGRFILTIDPPDSFDSDNRLYFVQGGTGVTTIAVLGTHSRGRYGVQKVLGELPDVKLVNIDGDRLPDDIACDAVVAYGVPISDDSPAGLYFLPPSAPDFRPGDEALKGSLTVSDAPLHSFMRDADGKPFKLLRGNLSAGRACEFGPSWQPVLLCEGKTVVANRMGTNIWAVGFYPSEEFTDWVLDPSFVVFVARFAQAVGDDSNREILRRTDAGHLLTGFAGSAGYNLISDVESDLRGNKTESSASAPQSPASARRMQTPIGWLFFAAVAILLALRAVMALYRT